MVVPKLPMKNQNAMTQANATCQKCLGKGHWTYQCKNPRKYVERISRSRQLERQFKKEKGKKQLALLPPPKSKQLSVVEKKRKRKKKKTLSSSSDDSSSSSSDSSSSSSDSDTSDSDVKKFRLNEPEALTFPASANDPAAAKLPTDTKRRKKMSDDSDSDDSSSGGEDNGFDDDNDESSSDSDDSDGDAVKVNLASTEGEMPLTRDSVTSAGGGDD